MWGVLHRGRRGLRYIFFAVVEGGGRCNVAALGLTMATLGS